MTPDQQEIDELKTVLDQLGETHPNLTLIRYSHVDPTYCDSIHLCDRNTKEDIRVFVIDEDDISPVRQLVRKLRAFLDGSDRLPAGKPIAAFIDSNCLIPEIAGKEVKGEFIQHRSRCAFVTADGKFMVSPNKVRGFRLLDVD